MSFRVSHLAIVNFFLFFLVILLVAMPIIKFNNLHTSFFDLGIFINQNFHHAWEYENIWRGFFGHLHGFYFVLSPLYKLFDYPQLLLLFQSLFIVSSILFMPDKNRFFIMVFLLCYAVWYNALFDFHYDHLLIPLMMAFYYFSSKGYLRGAVLAAILVCFVKEPHALVCTFMGLYLLLKHRHFKAGIFLVIFGLVYFYIATNYVIPSFTPEFKIGGNDQPIFGAGGSLLDIALYPVTHFKTFIIDIFTTKKIIYLFVLFSAFGFVIVFFSIKELIPAIPAIGIAMLSNLDNYYIYRHHYTASLIAPFMVAFIYGWPKFVNFVQTFWMKYTGSELAQKTVIFIVIGIIFISHILFSPSPFSRYFWIGKIAEYNKDAYFETERAKQIKQVLQTIIPADVSLSAQNSLNTSVLAERKIYLPFPQGVNQPYCAYRTNINSFFEIFSDNKLVTCQEAYVDFFVIDYARPLYLYDRGVEKELFASEVDKAKSNYVAIYRENGLAVFKNSAYVTDDAVW